MFETRMLDQLERIFDVPKVTYDKPSSSKEQNVLFVDVLKSTAQVREKSAKARVRGTLTMYAPANKLTFGWFDKQIYKSNKADSGPFYFYNIDENDKVLGNVVERKCSFIYFYSDQYDPEHGSLTSVDF